MPYINEVELNTVSGILAGNTFNVRAQTDIGFTRLERELKLSYKVKFALYHIDGQMDVYSVQPNWGSLFLQRAARFTPGDKDTYIAFSPAIDITNNDSRRQRVQHTFEDIKAKTAEYGEIINLKALVVCLPQTAAAMKWSNTKEVPVQFR